MFGGVERHSANYFLVPVDRRDKKTLLPIIRKYILPGSIIISDCWKAYANLDKFDYTHQTVNHSQTFKDPKTGACTNTIEGLWRIAKHRIPHYRRKNSDFIGYLAKFMFLSKIKRNGLEPVAEFCKEAGLMYEKTKFTLKDITHNKNKNNFEEIDDI